MVWCSPRYNSIHFGPKDPALKKYFGTFRVTVRKLRLPGERFKKQSPTVKGEYSEVSIFSRYCGALFLLLSTP